MINKLKLTTILYHTYKGLLSREWPKFFAGTGDKLTKELYELQTCTMNESP